MARVEWSRLEPGDVEHALAVMIQREQPTAQRIRPSRGDRGIDILVQSGSEPALIYQVKSFTGALTNSQKLQIKKSIRTLREYVQQSSIKIDEWLLVRPEDPTHEDREWLAGALADAPFPGAWRGLTFCDRLAGDHPSVVDYYLRDEKDRLHTQVKDVLAGLGLGDQRVATAAAASRPLQQVYDAVNEMDPHYRYEFEVVKSGPPLEQRDVAARLAKRSEEAPDLVAEVAQRGHDDTTVITRIYSRYANATSDYPLPGSMVLTPRVAGPGAEQVLRDFLRYGIAPSEGSDATDMTTHLPGGLASTGEVGRVWIGPSLARASGPRRLELHVTGPDVGGSVLLEVSGQTRGVAPAASGFAIQADHDEGCFRVLLILDEKQSAEQGLRIVMDWADLVGVRVAAVHKALRFLSLLSPPNSVSISIPEGAELIRPQPLRVPFFPYVALPLQVAEALAAAQRVCRQEIPFPDLREMSEQNAREWLMAGELAAGKGVSLRWLQAHFFVADGYKIPEPVEDGVLLQYEGEWALTIGGEAFSIGSVRHTLQAKVAAHPLIAQRIDLQPGASDWCLLETIEGDSLNTSRVQLAEATNLQIDLA